MVAPSWEWYDCGPGWMVIGAPIGGVGSHGRCGALAIDGIAGFLEFLLDDGGSELLAGADFGRSGVDFRGLREEWLLESVVDDVAVLVPVEGEDQDGSEGADSHDDAGADEDFLRRDANGHVGNFQFYRHMRLRAFPSIRPLATATGMRKRAFPWP